MYELKITDEQDNCPCHRFGEMNFYTGKEHPLDQCRICGLPAFVLHEINRQFNEWLNKIFPQTKGECNGNEN